VVYKIHPTNDAYDIVVVGAGTSGSISARFAAQFGLKVCLIDACEQHQIGNKICGDAIDPSIFDYLSISKGDEILTLNSALRLYSPDEQNYLSLDVPMYFVDRLRFGQKLLKEAIEAGNVQFMDNTRAIDLVYDENSVSGVRVKRKHKEKKILNAKIIIDASGIHSPLRRNIKSIFISKEVPKWDLAVCYRENIRYIKEKTPPPTHSTLVVDPGQRTPGGYLWRFPKSDNIVNIGLGTFLHHKGLIKTYFQKYAHKHFIKNDDIEILSSAGCVVPLRRPLPSCADNGIMLVGDAGCQVNPANGAGIDKGMKAGYYAAVVAKDAIDAGDCSVRKLWEYNYRIMTDFGAAHASADVMRLFFQHGSSDDLNFIIAKKILDGNDIADLMYHGLLNLNFIKRVKKFVKGITRPRLLLKLNSLSRVMKKINTHYNNYPKSVELFEKWKQKENIMFKKIYSKFINSTY
jgi:geranylgeranyl reductase family protein